MKLKVFGKIIMNKINLNSMRLEILKASMKYLVKDGWNNNIFSSVSKKGKFKEEEMRALFPKGYKSLLELYLSNIDKEMIESCNKINLIRMRTHQRIREIILARLKINRKNKKLVKRTFLTLMLPQNTKIATFSLYNTVDQMWYLAGDNSTDFNFYTKRAILAFIYSSTICYWINHNNDNVKTKQFLDKQLTNVNKLSKKKKSFKPFFEMAPKIFSLVKNFSTSRR
jgi:ubiquinone biosynthesis protein COQ9